MHGGCGVTATELDKTHFSRLSVFVFPHNKQLVCKTGGTNGIFAVPSTPVQRASIYSECHVGFESAALSRQTPLTLRHRYPRVTFSHRCDTVDDPTDDAFLFPLPLTAHHSRRGSLLSLTETRVYTLCIENHRKYCFFKFLPKK